MDPLNMGMQALRISRFLSSGDPPTYDDKRRLKQGQQFIARSLAVREFFDQGSMSALEPNAIASERYANRTLHALRSTSTNDDVRTTLRKLGNLIEKLISRPEAIEDQERTQLQGFFSQLSEALMAEVLVDPQDEDDDESATDESMDIP